MSEQAPATDSGEAPGVAGDAEVVVRAVDVERHYALGGGVVRAVDGVSLEIRRGEAVAILGPSGSGKSTLMHLLGALDRPSAGEMWVGGQALAELSPVGAAAYRRDHVGFVFQAFHLQPQLSALENVALPLKLAGAPRAERRARATALLERVGLGDRLHHRPSELSGGQQQRVSIARALSGRPRLLLADEPTGNLDSRTGAEVMALFEALRSEEGVTLVLVTHDPEVASKMSRIVTMRDGKVVSDEAGAAPQAPAEVAPQPAPAGWRPSLLGACGDALRGLSRQRLRAALTACGIAIGAMAIALMVGLGFGLHDFIIDQARSINDPLSLWVTNSSYSWSDIAGNRAQQMGQTPQPIKERAFEKLSKARAGFEPFDDDQVAALRAIPGVVDVRPRTYVILDGVRLVPEGEERLDPGRPAASDTDGGPNDFEGQYYIGYALVRSAGAAFRIAAGRKLRPADQRGVILSYQYAEAWQLEPEALVGREIELLFPALGGYADFNFLVPQEQVEARYRSYRAVVLGLTTKSVLSAGVFLPPPFGEEISGFQFERGTEGLEDSVGGGGMMGRLGELAQLLRDPALTAELEGAAPGSEAAELRELAQAALLAMAGSGRSPLELMARLGQLRELLGSPIKRERLRKIGPRTRRLVELLLPLAGVREAAAPEDEGKRKWGSRIRVRVSDEQSLERVKQAIKAQGMKVQSLQEGLQMVTRVFAVIDAFLSSFGLIALVVAALGIANTLFMAVMERTREIGVMKAVGATEGRIRLLFALEAAAIGLVGGVAGVLLALGAGALINTQGVALVAPDWAGIPFFSPTIGLLALTVLGCSLLALLAGLYPAHRAARLDPIEALRSD